MYKAIIAIGIVAAACLVAGCGSGSDETAEAAVTKTQFIEQAEAICNKARNEAQDAAAAWEKAKGRRLDINAALTEVIGPTLKKEAAELQSLALPEGDEAQLTRMIDNLSKAATAVTSGANSAPASTAKAFRQTAEAYGINNCQF